MANEVTIDRKLIEIFEEAYYLYDTFEIRQDPTNSDSFQADIRKAIELMEDATRLVSLCGVFSSNESYEEISTTDLRYLLLPFFLAQLNLKICGSDRRHNVEIAEVYYKDFLKRCREYGLYNDEKEDQDMDDSHKMVAPRTEAEQLQRMAYDREQKIKKYQEKKELSDQIKQLKIAMSAEHIDDDVKREYYMKLLESCIIEAKDELITINQEKAILEHLARRESEPHSTRARHPMPTSKPLKPIIITKDLVQKAVYGAGYPSLPTMTVAEFYEQRVRDGIFPDPEKSKEMQKYALQNRTDEMEKELEEQEEIEKEERVENDDPEHLERARAMDDWKDDHRRGFGNRYNRS